MGLCIRWPSSKLKLLNYERQIPLLANVVGLKKHMYSLEAHLVYKTQRIYKTKRTLSGRYSRKRLKMVVV